MVNGKAKLEPFVHSRKNQSSQYPGCLGKLSCLHHEDIVVKPQRSISCSRSLAVVFTERAHNHDHSVTTEPFVFSVGAQGTETPFRTSAKEHMAHPLVTGRWDTGSATTPSRHVT